MKNAEQVGQVDRYYEVQNGCVKTLWAFFTWKKKRNSFVEYIFCVLFVWLNRIRLTQTEIE